MARLSLRRSAAALSCALLASTLLLASGLSHTADAAPAPGAPPTFGTPPPDPILPVNDPRNPLHLTGDQQKKISVLRLQLRTEGLQLMSDKSLTKEQQNQKFVEMQAATVKNMRALLNPAQQAQVDRRQAMMKKVMAMRQQAGQRYQILKQQLAATVTPDQKAKLAALDTTTRKQGMAIQSSASLTQVQKQTQLVQLQNAYTGKINATLSKPVQRQLMQKLIQLQMQERTAEMQAVHP